VVAISLLVYATDAFVGFAEREHHR
jgi:hypothetical protein